MTVWQRGGGEGQLLYGQCLFELSTFQKGASLIFLTPIDSLKSHLQQVGPKARKSLDKEQPQKPAPRTSPVGRRYASLTKAGSRLTGNQSTVQERGSKKVQESYILVYNSPITPPLSAHKICWLDFLLAILISDLVMQIIRIYGMYINLEQAHTVFWYSHIRILESPKKQFYFGRLP